MAALMIWKAARKLAKMLRTSGPDKQNLVDVLQQLVYSVDEQTQAIQALHQELGRHGQMVSRAVASTGTDAAEKFQ